MANVLNEGRSVFAAPFAFKISLMESVHIANLLSVQCVVVAALFFQKTHYLEPDKFVRIGQVLYADNWPLRQMRL